MIFKLVIGAATLAAVSAAGAMALAQAAAPVPLSDPLSRPVARAFAPLAVRQVKPGLFMLTGNGGNAVVRVADDGVILVDTGLTGDNFYQELVQKVRTLSNDKPIRYVFVTHVHNDHSGNTAQFEAAGIPVIASDAYKALVQIYAVRTGQERSPAPTVTYAKSYTVKLKGATATANAMAPAHTASDSIVYFPDLKVVAMGDNGFPGAPTLDWLNGGRLRGMQKNWADVAKMDFELLIPGHGAAPLNRAEFEANRKKLDILIERLSALVKAGTPRDELLTKVKVDDLGPLWNIKGMGDEWSRPARLKGLYAELSQ